MVFECCFCHVMSCVKQLYEMQGPDTMETYTLAYLSLMIPYALTDLIIV